MPRSLVPTLHLSKNMRLAAHPFVRALVVTTPLVMFHGLAGRALAQFDGAEVVGTIRDTSGAVIPNAEVTLLNVRQGTELHRATDAQGDFDFPSVQIGQYTITVQKAGFSQSRSDTFAVQIAARQRVDLALKTGQASDTVTVEAAASALETDTSDRGEVIDHREAIDLPLNGRVTTDLALLIPGVRLSLSDTNLPGSREAAYNVNGQRNTANNFLLDGLDNNYYSTENQGFSSQVIHPSPDATEEFKVQTDNYSAEYGRAGGAIINVSSRSGTNNLHGVVYDYLRNTDLNAYGVFYGTGIKPTLIQNQYGATLGGPILKNKLFFFTDYEGFRYIATAYATSTLPTAAQRLGNFTEQYTVPVVNPFTNVVYANGMLPTTLQSSFARSILAALPANTVAGFSNNYTQLSRSTEQADKGDVRLDYDRSERLKLFGRFSKQRFNIFAAPGIPGPAGGSSSGNEYGYNTQGAFGATYVLSPRALFEGRMAFTSTVSGKDPATEGLPSLLTANNIGGLPAPTYNTPSLNVQAVNGFTAFGTQSSNPAAVNPYTVNPKVNFTYQMGKHSLKAGYEYLALYLGYADEYPLYGDDVYNGAFTKGSTPAPTGTPSTLTKEVYGVADFLLGARSQYTLSGTQAFNYNQRFHYFYVQDDWRALPNLTLNLGLRYELVTPPWVDGNQLSNFSPATNNLIYAHAGSLYDRALVHVNHLNFAPRFGFAYQADARTAIRAGYALSYVQGNRNGAEGALAYNTVADSVINQTTSQPLCASAAANPTTCFLTAQQGYPQGFTSSLAYNANGEYRYTPANSPTGYVQSYQMTVQRELTPKTVLDVAYVGSHGVHLRILTDYNQALANPGVGSTNCPGPVGTTGSPCASLLSRRRIQGYDAIIEPIPAGFSLYNSLQVKLRHSFAHGFYILNSLTWSQAYDNAAAQYEVNGGDSAVVNYYNIAGDHGRSGYNQPYNDTTSLLYDLPYGHGRRFGSGASYLMQTALGGWTVTAINQAASGLPINLTYDPATSGTQNATVSDASVAYSYRPNITGPVSAVVNPSTLWVKSASSLSGLYNTSVLSAPLYTQPFGNVSRNVLTGFAYQSLTMGLHKQFPLWSELSNLEFRAEAFNLLNSVNYQTPTSDISSGSFGSITSAYPARQLQVALRLSY